MKRGRGGLNDRRKYKEGGEIAEEGTEENPSASK
jgi:hypothetical protein